eukprot:TRINITY_DN1217_c0_g1_i6.p1 TRINITY_DN1217_c0_g1~~TRINITY_DN1217_c0_g1_i6.p1  ORF type:complete len:323 (+),score=-20.03 TRINITY_DN1217_c0_g1_i6:845-1813(+)
MKKLVTAFAACIVAGLVSAQVESQNVVGYMSLTIPATQWTLLGLPFKSVGDTNGISVQSFFVDPIGTGFKAGANAASADNLMFWAWTGSSYTYFSLYLYDSTATSTAAIARKNKWINPGSVPDSTWGANNGISTLPIKPGDAFWVKRVSGSYASAITTTVSGEVVMGANASSTIREGYNLVASPFAASFVPNPDSAGTGSAVNWITMGAKGGANAAASDNMMFWAWSGSVYTYYTLYLYDSTATSTAAVARKNHWINPGSVPDSTWGANNGISIYQHPATASFWYKRLTGQGNFTLTQTRPYTANQDLESSSVWQFFSSKRL